MTRADTRLRIVATFCIGLASAAAAPGAVRAAPAERPASPALYARTIGDPIESDFNPSSPRLTEPDFHPASSGTPEAASAVATEKRFLSRLSIDIGSDTEPDLLAPTIPKGLVRNIDRDYRVVFQDDRLGFNVQQYERERGKKLSFSFRQRIDFPTLIGVGGTRNALYESLGQRTPSRDVRGYVVGSAVAFNHYWGASVSYDEYFKNVAFERFNKRVVALGLGYSPLGDNRGKLWSFTIDPYLTYEKFHGLIPTANARHESVGYSIGPSFYYGLDWVEVPHMLGPKRSARLDRLKVSVGVSDSEVSPLSVTLDINVTAYANSHLKLKTGFTDTYRVPTGKQEFHLKAGASLRLSLRDLRR
jgi:hypothetical protein